MADQLASTSCDDAYAAFAEHPEGIDCDFETSSFFHFDGTETNDFFCDLQAPLDSSNAQLANEVVSSPSPSISGGMSAPTHMPSADDRGNGVTIAVKAGSRFTSAAVRVLRTWFENHERHPYPTPEQIIQLQNQTGLSKQQLTNWFANTRRRRKFRPIASSSPKVPYWTEWASEPMEIPPRRPTPRPFEDMNPLQRWEHSPPEHEPALVSDISRAVAASSRRSGPSTRSRSSGRSSGNASSISSVVTSLSSRDSRSNASAHSYGSNNSVGRLESTRRDTGRRRRRATTKPQHGRRLGLVQARNTYQCTFCAETFKTKYDWQRHEKSLHLSLEEWICSPHGSTEIDPERGVICVYCGEINPDQNHLDGHYQAACSDRPSEERTFYRKDHLRQHLKLVHRTNQIPRSIEKWKITKDDIRSRCGFCGISLESWSSRGDHLAEHFKNGNAMSDWEGDWGFEPSVIAMLDNALPPCKHSLHLEYSAY